MELQNISIKLYSRREPAPDLETFVPVFHSWIQNDAVPELAIDVANYAHVPGGPGVLLIGHEANYSVEFGREERFGVRYTTRTELAGDNQVRIHHAVQQAVTAALKLQQDRRVQNALDFSAREIVMTANRKESASNTRATFVLLEPELEAVFDAYFGNGNFDLALTSPDERDHFTVTVKGKVEVALEELLQLGVNS